MILIYIFVFGLGAIIGSFLNVVVDRLGTGRSLGGRSKCDATGKTLKWFELVPILSFLFLKGKSRYSKTKLSIQYPLVEFFTGLTFLFIFNKFWYLVFSFPASFVLSFFFFATIFSILVAIVAYDIKHKIIPDSFVWTFNILALLNILAFHPNLFSLLAGPIVALPLFLLWLVSKGRWLGFGDVKFALGMGWLLGISAGFAALLLSFWLGALIGIFVLLAHKKKNTQIPFAPFLVLGTFLSFLYSIDMYSISRFFNSIL